MTDNELAALIKSNYDAVRPAGSAPIDQALCLPMASAINTAVGGATNNHSDLDELDYASAGHTGFEPARGADDNYVTDAEKIVIGNTSGVNTGDQDLSGLLEKKTDVTAVNDTGIADGEIAVFNKTNKDIRTSDKTIVTTLGADDTTVPTSKAVKTVTDGKENTIGYTPENVANKKTDLSDNSDTYYPSQKAVKTAVDAKKDNSMNPNKLLGRAATGVGVIEEITLGDNLSFDGTTLNAAGGGITGANERLASMDIDGVTNTIDTNKALYTVGEGDYIRSAKLVICNRNGGLTARVRVAHIDGAIGDIAVSDYLLYDDYLLPYEIKIIEIDGLIPTDTLLVRSNVTNVNFILTGEVLATDIEIGRKGVIDIDGSTNTVATDYEVYTATESCKVNILICNRNAGNVVECQLAIIDSADIGDIADEDRLFFILDTNQTVFVEGEFNLALDEMVAFRSDTANVNCIVYRVG